MEGNEVEVVVFSRNTDPKVQAAPLGDFVLSADFYHRDPSRGFIAKSRDFLSDPFVGLTTGILVGAVLSYFFYRRSIARRTVLYALVVDRTVLHSEQTRESRLQVMRGNKPVLEHVGACSVTIRFKGLRDLREEEIMEPIRLRFKNITSILRATADATQGWGPIAILQGAPTSIVVPVKHVKSGDRLQLDVFYTQKDLSVVDVVRESGRFVDGDILPDRDDVHRWRTRIAFSIFALYLLAFLVGIIDRWIFRFPMGIYHLADDIFAVWWIPPLVFILWFLLEPATLNSLGGHLRRLRRPADSKDSTMIRFEVEPKTPE